MTDVPREQLVILEADLAEQARPKVEAAAVVTQLLRPRLLLIRADAKAAESVARIAGVKGVYDSAPPDTSLDLSAAERVFIAAWQARLQPKTRPGEGLPWDAPGFEPPDPPTGRTR